MKIFITLSIFFACFVSPAVAATATLPSINKITPTTVVVNETVTLSALVSDDDVLDSCTLLIDEEEEESMTVKRDVVYTTTKFDETGISMVLVTCTDSDGHSASSKQTSITVSEGSSHVETGTLIKTGCEGDVYPNDPCTAVYFYGVDGKRHAFPTEAVFKSWYSNFDDVVVLSKSVMSDIPLGKNVTYKPGQRMVKFSNNTVYAVSYAGLLRPIANEEIAETLFGEDWISLIETVDDVFYGNYRIGATIESSSSFSWTTARNSTTSINTTL